MDTLNIHDLLLSFISDNKFLFIIYFICSIFEYPIHYLYIPDYYGRVINSFKDKKQFLFLYYFKILVLLYILEWAFNGCVLATLYWIVPKFSEFATGKIFEFIIDHYELDFDNIPMGEILSKIIKMPNILFEYIDLIKNEFLKYFFVFMSGFIHYSSVSYNITLIYGFFVILNYAYIWFMMKQLSFYDLKSNKLQDNMYEMIIDCLNNMTSIYTFNQEQSEKDRFYSKSFAEYKQNMYDIKLLFLKSNLFWGIISVSIFLIMNYVVYNTYLRHEITTEKLISTFIITFSLIRIFEIADRSAYNISKIQSQIKDAETFFNRLSNVNHNEMKKPSKTFRNGDIVFSNVYHRYKPEGGFALENANITIKKGEKIAFVGQIGSGKSTIVKLLMGFQPLRMGSISIGGISINDITNKEIREHVFYIPQKPKLFNRTLYENIVYGLKTPPSREEIVTILGDLELDYLKIEFDNKMDLSVGVEGNNLSGGQKQIIWLLRSMFRPSYILVLDEPTASLDPDNKKKMLLIIQKMSIGKTVIIVSHDEIDSSFRKVEFNEGKIVTSNFF